MLRHRARHALLAMSLVLPLTASPMARAQTAPAPSNESPSAASARLKAEGDELFRTRRYAEALAKYDEAYGRDRNAALLYNRARSLEALTRHAEALDALERFVSEATPELKARVPGLNEMVGEFRGRVARLIVRCPVANARVLVDSKQIATTPVDKPLRVNAGKALVEVVADGYFPFTKSLDLTGGTEVAFDAPLKSRQTSALVVVKSQEPEAEVSVDGKPMGWATAEVPVDPGQHQVVVRKSGYRDAEITIVVKSGERRDLALDPTRRAITERWYFWAGVGAVVVAAAVVTVVALTTEREGTKGENFSPDSVRLPLVKF